MNRISTIERGRHVYVADNADADTIKFARLYAKVQRGTAEATYVLAETIRNGFAGSGEWVYRAADGSLYRVWAVANGSSFYGTDYHIGKEATK